MIVFVCEATASAQAALSELQVAKLLIFLRQHLPSWSWPTLQESLGTKVLHLVTQNICCKYGSVLSPGPLTGPPAHDNRMRNINGMNQPGGVLFPTTCVNRLVCPLSCETSGEDACGLSTAPQKALPAPRSNKEKAWTKSACVSRAVFVGLHWLLKDCELVLVKVL